MSVVADDLFQVIDSRTRDLLELRERLGPARRRGWLIRRALLLADVLGLTVAFVVAQQVYTSGGAPGGIDELLAFVVSLPLWVFAAKIYGLYDKDEERTGHSTTDDFAGVFHLVTVCTFGLFALSHETRWLQPPIGKLLVFWVPAIAGVTLCRAGARAYCRRQLNYLQNTIIVGAGEVGQEVARKLLKHPEYGINLVGFVDANPRQRIPGLRHLTLLGEERDIPELVDLLDVERVIIAFSSEHHEAQIDLIRKLNALDVQVDIVPRFFDVLSDAVDFHTIEGLPVCSIPPARLSRSTKVVKRTLDIVCSAVGLLVLAPFLVVVAVAVKVDSRGPVLFHQLRMGEGSRPFRMWKFRSMTADAEERKAALIHLNKHLVVGGDPRMFKIDRDPRVTRVGEWLRRTSVDELPQLWNVLRGDMSLVGPRPLIPSEHAHISDWAQRRLDLRPGITGLWQVLGRDEIGFGGMVRLDYQYVTTWSLAGDLRLLLRTLPVVCGWGRGAR